MKESKFVRTLYVLALALLVIGSIQSSYSVFDIQLNPKVGNTTRGISPIVSAQAYFTSSIVIVLSLYRGFTVIIGGRLTKVDCPSTFLGLLRNLGLLIMFVGVLGGLINIIGTSLALVVENARGLLLVMPILSIWLNAVPVVIGLFLFEMSRLFSFELSTVRAST